ncbi:MAG: threonine/serine dehydratase [Actinomycetota bacterium]
MIRVPTYEDILAAAKRIAPYVHRTPVFTSEYLDGLTGASVFLKAENMQKVGAFKARGATNAVLSLSEEDAARGVATHSSGNHGQAVAYACTVRGVPATVVMPDHAPQVKVDAVSGYGARIVFCSQSERQATLDAVVEETGATFVHPYDDPSVIAGQGTASLELVEQVDDLDVIITPIGGGGLLSGATIVSERHGFRAWGAEPEIVDDSYRSLRDGVRYGATGALSIGDGLLTGIGEIPFAILSEAGTQVLLVSEQEILYAMGFLAVRTKLVVEPSGAAGVAAVIRYSNEFSGKRVGIILSGGNVELSTYASS